MIKLDSYSIKARVYPAFLVLLPILILAIYYVTDFEMYYHYITALFTVGFLTFVLAHLGRDKGKLKEENLFEKIGGKPTTQILRHSDSYLDSITKSRYHKSLSTKVSDLIIPTKEEESENPSKADEIYNSCAKYVISKTRDTKKFDLLFKENINYGFRRNTYGLKSWAVFILIISLFTHAIIASKYLSEISFQPSKDLIPYVAFIILGFFWLFIVSEKWVKLTAFAYAERLYESIDEI